MKPRTLAVFALALILICTAVAGEDVPDHVGRSGVLFPETVSWLTIQTLRRPPVAYLREAQQQLVNAYVVSKIGKAGESADCSVIGRIFADDNLLKTCFFTCDADGDGADDIIYAGPAECAEGNATIIWFREEQGFAVRQDVLWQMLALRVKPGKVPAISSVEVGCCAGLTDTYYVGTLDNFRLGGMRRILKDEVMPSVVVKPTEFAVTQRELVLRSSPKVNDRYDEGISQLQHSAVLGNVLARYLPGCTGVIVGRQKQKDGKVWYFVVLSEPCDYLRVHDPFSTNAGWIEENGLSRHP